MFNTDVRIAALKKQLSDDIANPNFNKWSSDRAIGQIYSYLNWIVSILEDMERENVDRRESL